MTGRFRRGDGMLVAHVAVLGRFMPDLAAALAEIEARGVGGLAATEGGAWTVKAQDLDGARRDYAIAAEAERRARTRERGVRVGRPPVPPERIEKVRATLARGGGLRASARLAAVGPATAARVRAGTVEPPEVIHVLVTPPWCAP